LIAGRYTLDREIGRGGMGAVWLGEDEVLGRPVALKRIGFGPGGDDLDLDRAEREARLAARLNHPHVVAVYDLVVEGDDRWLVMEYVAGATLAELVRRDGPLTPDQAAPLLRQAADALAAAHEAGIVHRDVKPSNILVTPDGQVKLSDFGIARAQADASLTQTGLVTGSPAYLAPEVASGQQATAASDVWSLGATTYHALSGRPPYGCVPSCSRPWPSAARTAGRWRTSETSSRAGRLLRCRRRSPGRSRSGCPRRRCRTRPPPR
jgi:serine/threonine protein kinase